MMTTGEYTAEHAAKGGETPPIEAWPNQYSDRRYEIVIEHPEFTCLCPRTGLPDFAHKIVTHLPAEKCIELKSFKYYLGWKNFRPQNLQS